MHAYPRYDEEMKVFVMTQPLKAYRRGKAVDRADKAGLSSLTVEPSEELQDVKYCAEEVVYDLMRHLSYTHIITKLSCTSHALRDPTDIKGVPDDIRADGGRGLNR